MKKNNTFKKIMFSYSDKGRNFVEKNNLSKFIHLFINCIIDCDKSIFDIFFFEP